MEKKYLRNIGISAHIDSGKTTLTERILFYTKRIHAMHEVKGRDGVGATLDSMELERERGITIASAATHCVWSDHHINIIDTPGHIDFTIEVERSLRVLDGAILVLCAVGGVQSQSLAVDRQMRRYQVPRIAFINKCDRRGANPLEVCEQLAEKLGHTPVLLQLPIGLEHSFEGLIDLITMTAMVFSGDCGETVQQIPIPDSMKAKAETAREKMLDKISLVSDQLTEAILEEQVTPQQIIQAIREGTLSRQITPVLMGSAYKNKGVQPLLDAVTNYLPNPMERKISAISQEQMESYEEDDPLLVELACDDHLPTVALAFKLEDGKYGQLTYLRIYQGSLVRGNTLINMRTRQKHKTGRIIRMHANEMEEIQQADAGDIVAIFGIDCQSGDTFTDGRLEVTMTGMYVPEPVISLSLKAEDTPSETKLAKALNRFTKEDPTFRVHVDPDSHETVISGMGELQLEVYLERIRREYQATVTTSPPRVAFRETISKRVKFNYTHKKQTGGAGQYARVAGYLEPNSDQDFELQDSIVGGAIPRQFIASVEKGFTSMLEKGRRIGAKVVNVRVVINDGKSHSVDSSEMAFQEAARGAWRQVYSKAVPKILEPIMQVSVEVPKEYAGNVMGNLMQRRGNIIGSQEEITCSKVEAEVPLAEMFGYSTSLRSSTQGMGNFTMEFSRYQRVPSEVAKKIEAEIQEKLPRKNRKG